MTRPLVVAVDASPVRPGTGGVGRYVAELIAHLPDRAAGRPLTVVPLTNRPDAWLARFHAGQGPSPRAHIAPPPPALIRRPTLAWLQWEAARQARQPGIALFHATTGRAPLRHDRPTVVTVHDTAVIDVPALFPYRERWLAGLWLRASVPRATAIVCVSRSTGEAVLRRWPHTATRMRIVRPGAGEHWMQPPAPLSDELAGVVGRRWWLHVGACTVLKNVVRLVEAYAHVHRQVGEPVPNLVLVGPEGDADAGVRATAAALGVAERVLPIGPVDDATLHALYAGAELTACVGLHEGFGLTALEALASGCPVVSSGRGGLRDAAPCGALVADPTAGTALELALAALGTNASLRARLGEDGRAHAATATWRRTALATAEVYAVAVAGD
ncbi:MAG: glycosyltransferase family 4 protein [Ardenticatenales bacterium]|nr:glycosyltransferase family 4 protein [Ardenticatenales bacterium]